MDKTRGFITIATGKEEYYRLALNLLRSYRYFCSEPLPFALLCDRENEYTAAFDDVILFRNGATNSYLDKLELAEYAPYDETIFIDADCLAYCDINHLFPLFADADDVSCFGRILPLDNHTGWFEYENLGDLKDQVNYLLALHGGIYYIRRGPLAKAVFQKAKEFASEYSKYHFKGKFDSPGDEPVIALSLAVNKYRPIPFQEDEICCYWNHLGAMKLDISAGSALFGPKMEKNAKIVHWGTRYTRTLEYEHQLALLTLLEEGHSATDPSIRQCRKQFDKLLSAQRRTKRLQRFRNKIQRCLHKKP